LLNAYIPRIFEFFQAPLARGAGARSATGGSFLSCNVYFGFCIIYYNFMHIFSKGGFVLNNNNFDMAKLMNILSKMDKKDLEAGIAKANQILGFKDADKIINEIKKK